LIVIVFKGRSRRMKDGESAFPVLDSYVFEGGGSRLDCRSWGMTLPQYAAIHLRVPCSGDPELDAAIRQSRRLAFVEGQLAAMFVEGSSYVDQEVADKIAEQAFRVADALLAEWEKEVGNG
jgi:hypothetical protein